MPSKIALFWPGDARPAPNAAALSRIAEATIQLEKALAKLNGARDFVAHKRGYVIIGHGIGLPRGSRYRYLLSEPSRAGTGSESRRSFGGDGSWVRLRSYLAMRRSRRGNDHPSRRDH
jgi:hypothetical protein